MCRTPQTVLTDASLVKYLDNPGNMEILLDGKTSPEEFPEELVKMVLAKTVDLQGNRYRSYTSGVPGASKPANLARLRRSFGHQGIPVGQIN